MTQMGDLANSMRDRMPWPVARRIFEENGVIRGRGWIHTIAKLSSDRQDFSEQVPGVTESLREHVLCGEKLTRFYNVDEVVLDRAYEAAQGIAVPPSVFRDRFPQILSEDELEGVPLGHTLVAVDITPEGISIVFSSVRSVTTRVELSEEDLPDGSGELMSRYDEIVGVKNKKVQGLDVVWLPNHGQFVEVRVDFPLGMLRPAADAAHASVRGALTAIFSDDMLSNPVNLYPVISSMYHDKSEGSVVELAFGTTTAALKHEKMRRGSLSLRDESYHQGGLAALHEPIKPFKVSIEWDRDLGDGLSSKPELNLHATSRISGSENPRLFDAVIRNCMGRDDYEFVRERIRVHLEKGGSD